MNSGEAPLEVRPLEQGERGLWQDFLRHAVTGSLYHDLDFLDYHPVGRFRFEHLLLRQEGKIVALVPGGVSETEDGAIFRSPLGASFGGPAVERVPRTSQALAMVQALQEYVVSRGYAGMELTLAPTVFASEPSELFSFALFGRGFRLVHRWMCAMLDLSAADAPRYATFFHSRQSGLVRACRRKGMAFGEYGPEGLPLFLKVFRDTYARHGVRATHTEEEIAWLLGGFPERIKLYLATREECCVYGVLVFMLTPQVASTFYICSDTALAKEGGGYFLFAELADRLALDGVRWLDLGPCSWDGNFNAGVTFFKERLGCVMHCRDRWTWRADWRDGPVLATQNFISGNP